MLTDTSLFGNVSSVAQLDERLKERLAASKPIIDAAIFSVTVGMISVDVFA
jgi:hypothetical protein